MKDLKLLRGTIEYLPFTATADQEITDQVVSVSFDREAWLEAEWVGESEEIVADDGTVTHRRKGRVGPLDDTTLPADDFSGVFVKVTDNPEVPIKRAGSLDLS